jgi:hypothetical protein
MNQKGIRVTSATVAVPHSGQRVAIPLSRHDPDQHIFVIRGRVIRAIPAVEAIDAAVAFEVIVAGFAVEAIGAGSAVERVVAVSAVQHSSTPQVIVYLL